MHHLKLKGNGAAHLGWKNNTSLWWEMMTPHPTLWVRIKIEGWREPRSRCGRGSNHVHCIWKFHLDLIAGWPIPPNFHWFKDWKRAIDWRGKRSIFCTFIGQGQEIHLLEMESSLKGLEKIGALSPFSIESLMFLGVRTINKV
jgi:hypothetical protein